MIANATHRLGFIGHPGHCALTRMIVNSSGGIAEPQDVSSWCPSWRPVLVIKFLCMFVLHGYISWLKPGILHILALSAD